MSNVGGLTSVLTGCLLHLATACLSWCNWNYRIHLKFLNRWWFACDI